VYYTQPQGSDDDDIDNCIYFFPDLKEQRRAFVSTCVAADQFIAGIAGAENKVQVLEIGDAKVGFYHEEDISFVCN